MSEATKSCKAATNNPNANLASIPDRTTNDFLVSFVNWRSWIAGVKSWAWHDGSKIGYTNWALKQPSGDGSYLEIWGKNGTDAGSNPGQWNDLSSGHKRTAICQYVPESSQHSNSGIQLITKDNLVATLPSWGDQFDVSLEL